MTTRAALVLGVMVGISLLLGLIAVLLLSGGGL